MVALEDSDDENHKSALEFRERLRKSLTPFRTLYMSNYIIDETLTLLKERCGVSVAVSFREDLEKSSVVRVLWLEPQVDLHSWTSTRSRTRSPTTDTSDSTASSCTREEPRSS